MEYRNLKLIGTSHIAKQSLDEVQKAIDDYLPEIIAVELDRRRLAGLFMEQKGAMGPKLSDIRRVGLKGYLFGLIGAWAENKLGNSVGVSPGSEMKKAVVLAKERGLILALVDQDIEITLRRFSKALTWKEKWNFVKDMFNGFVLRKKENIGFNLNEVPPDELIKVLIDKVKGRYPTVHRVLIEERNEVMAENLFRLIQKHPEKKILAIVGAGHGKELIDMIREKDKTIVFSYSFDENFGSGFHRYMR